MTIGKINKPLPQITPQELAQKIATDNNLKGFVEKAIESSEKEYRAHYNKLLQNKKAKPLGIGRFQTTEADAKEFLEDIYQNLPSFFKKMIDDAVEEQGRANNLNEKHKEELKFELANVIDQEIRLKGKFA